MDFGGSIFFTCKPWRSDLNISGYVHLTCCFFELVSLTKAFLEPRAKKNHHFFPGFFALRTQYGLWRLKSENFWVTFFFYRYTLAGSNIKIPSTYVFFERAPLAETISDPKGKKTILFFLWFWSLLSTASMVYEGSKVKTFGSPFFLQVYPSEV